jgi:hypothetical protein
MDILTKFFFGTQPWQELSSILLIVGECALIFWYFRYLNGKYITLISITGISLFFFVLVNKVGSPSYLVWITPFLALLLINSHKQILLFYLVQGVVYLEAPILLGIVYAPRPRYAVLVNAVPSIGFTFYTLKFAIFFVVFGVLIHNTGREILQKTEGKDPE